ncbi:MAG: hypothetical protein WDZ93_00720 [Candidatus Paceibacterota bacterium]
MESDYREYLGMGLVGSMPILYILFWILFPTAALVYSAACMGAALIVALFPTLPDRFIEQPASY